MVDMDTRLVYDKALTPADFLVLTSLEKEAKQVLSGKELSPDVAKSGTKLTADDATSIARLKATRNPDHAEFTPTIFLSVDGIPAFIPSTVVEYLIKPYVCLARKIVRHETDVVMLTHLILYATTSVPSAIYLFRHFTYLHGFLHLILQGYYIGTYTLMMHQHIHQRGILTKGLALFDTIFPYLTDPLMGHTWNTYYYHHVKHHHVESNGPEDLSSTIRYQRDSIKDFLQYVGKFYFLVWLDLPLYFVRKNRPSMAVRAAGWEFGTYIFYYLMVTRVNAKAAMFVLVLPLMLVRFGLMAGNWGQHAFVDDVEPDSDFRSSITLIDVASNRFCFNDGYHTSHHLNPLRHWRDHPVSLLEQKHTYAEEGALVFHNIDFMMITISLLRKDYRRLAECMVPMGDQVMMSVDERVALLKRLTRRFSEEEIRTKFGRRKGEHINKPIRAQM